MMTEQNNTSDLAIPPGEYLEEVLNEIGISPVELAQNTNLSSRTINEIIEGQTAITAEMASQLALAIGIPVATWTQLEAEYRSILANQLIQQSA